MDASNADSSNMDTQTEQAEENGEESFSTSDSDGLDSSYSDLTSPQIVRKFDVSKPVETVTMEQSCKHMVEKISEYLNGELAATSEDYKLLETLNKLTVEKYSEMSTSTNTLISKMEEINERYKSLQPYLAQIDLLEESVLKLEQTAYKLDTYSKQLESKFKSMEKR